MPPSSPDRIQKHVLLRASNARVWRALTNTGEFGAWFGVELKGQFSAGKTFRGRITRPGFENVTLEATVERMDDNHFSFRWHPCSVDPSTDYSKERTTLVEFHLKDQPDGTLLTVTESGFDGLPAQRRDEAYRRNDEGWQAQMENIRRHVGG